MAKTAGFCFGVERAVRITRDEAGKGNRVFTYGPVTHNENVIAELEKEGVQTIAADIETVEKLHDSGELNDATLIIRSHGIGLQEHERLDALGINIIDATCPRVKKLHDIVSAGAGENSAFILCGDGTHPEVKGILGWAASEVFVISDENVATQFREDKNKKYTLISQTTFNLKKYQEIVEILTDLGYDISVLNTICLATEQRQKETEKLARESDAMIVIGSRESSNTRKLFKIAETYCNDTYYIRDLSDLDLTKLKSYRSVGITAGASTPKHIIEEVYTNMSESFAELFESYDNKTIHNGEKVEGTVISVKEDEIVLNIDYKSDGIITRNEYSNIPNLDLRTVVKEGDKLEAKVLKVNDGEGQVLLTYKRLAAERGSKRLEEAFNNKEVLKAVVTNVVEGGLNVVVDETRVFIPASLVSDSYEGDLSKFKDQEIEFVISEFNPKRRRIIGDRRQLVAAKKDEMKKAILEKLQVGDIFTGIVKNIKEFGVFVDLGGVDGLLHVSEMSWGRVELPRKVFKLGDEVRVFVKEIDGEKIALSKKFADENPWKDAETRFAVGNVVKGTVARMTEFGAFVELAKGVDALLHVSQISKDRVEKPADVLKVGQEIEAKIVDFNSESKKISLSIKALEAPEEDAAPAEEN